MVSWRAVRGWEEREDNDGAKALEDEVSSSARRDEENFMIMCIGDCRFE